MSRQENSTALNTTTNVYGQRKSSFKDVWRKAIEKYSPKKPDKLNEVSQRFKLKRDQVSKYGNKTVIENDNNFGNANSFGQKRSFIDEDDQQIKFVSIID